MTHEEAQNILSLCRPANEQDRKDPLIAEAIALTESDAALRAWFEAEQAADAEISAEFDQIEVPADLKHPFWPACGYMRPSRQRLH